jgi:hypothetical protein
MIAATTSLVFFGDRFGFRGSRHAWFDAPRVAAFGWIDVDDRIVGSFVGGVFGGFHGWWGKWKNKKRPSRAEGEGRSSRIGFFQYEHVSAFPSLKENQ